MGIRQGGSGEYRRPPNARGHSAKPTELTPSLDSTPPPCRPNRRSSKQISAEEGLASQPLTYLLFKQRPRALDSIAPRLSGVLASCSSRAPVQKTTPTHHLRPRRLQTTRRHAYVARSSLPHNTTNTTCWPLHRVLVRSTLHLPNQKPSSSYARSGMHR